jgi:Type II restriction endonuclease EcoO109I
MNRKSQEQLQDEFSHYVIVRFQQERLASLLTLRLHDSLKLAHPYLSFGTVNGLAGDLIRTVLDISIALQEQVIFKKLLKEFANRVSKRKNKGHATYLNNLGWNDAYLYRKYIAPTEQRLPYEDDTFKRAYVSKLNEMTSEFFDEFVTTEHHIDWLKLIDFVSKREDGKMSPSSNT